MEESVEFRQLIDVILRGKWVISIITIVAIVFSGIVSWFVLDEKYESKAVVQISSGVQDAGIISDFVATEFTPNIYMQRMQNVEQNKKFLKENGIDDFNNVDLSISNEPTTNVVEISYKSNSPEEAQKNLNLLMEKTKKEINFSMKETLNQLEQVYLKESTTLSNEIEDLMTNYNNIVISNKLPEVLILQTIASEQFVLNLTGEQTNALATITGPIQNELLQLKTQVDVKSSEYRTVLEKYQSVKTGIDSFKPDPFIRVIIDPTLGDKPSAPNRLLNIAIGLFIGLMVGLGWVIFREYWKTTSK